MKSISIFITTYDNSVDLNNCIRSIQDSDIKSYVYNITVINNNSKFSCEFTDISVLHNQTRPDFSTGHLSRTWNQCIINGFGDLRNPKCDILITLQDDVILKPNWLSLILPYMEKYSFIELGGGDIMCIYSPQSVRDVGLWDERFCNIGYHEGDYFLRQRLYNPNPVSINDYCHNRIHNPIYSSDKRREIDNEFLSVPIKNSKRIYNSDQSVRHHFHSLAFFKTKWGNFDPENWRNNTHPTLLIDSYILYPYFEYNMNIPLLKSKQRYNFS